MTSAARAGARAPRGIGHVNGTYQVGVVAGGVVVVERMRGVHVAVAGVQVGRELATVPLEKRT